MDVYYVGEDDGDGALVQMDLNVNPMKVFFQHVREDDLFVEVDGGFLALNVYHGNVHAMFEVSENYGVMRYRKLKSVRVVALVAVDPSSFVVL